MKHCLAISYGIFLTSLHIDRTPRVTYRERLSGLRIKSRELQILISQKSRISQKFYGRKY